VSMPVNFCDGAAEHAHLMSELKAMGELFQYQTAKHLPHRGDLERAEDRAVQANKADGGDLVEDLAGVDDFENAVRHKDVEAQKSLFEKLTPAAKAQAAYWNHDYALAIKLMTPLADAGDLRSQLNLSSIYTFSETQLSVKYLSPLPPKLIAIMKLRGPDWPPVDPPENLPLAFKYSAMAVRKGNIWGQWSLGRAYACGWGTEKDLVLAYMWLSLGLAQRGVTTEMTGASLPMKGSEKDYGVNRDFVVAQMSSEQIGKAQALMDRCVSSGYRDCLLPN
jgi:hypothetical protein